MKSQEKAINKRAMELTSDFMKTVAVEEAANLTEKKVFLLYKFDQTPEAMILLAIESMGDRDQARAYFKGIAKMVHPDKNSHPLAS